ncbi:hypothetical protein GCM10027030_18490 [Luteococcus sediminum]
MSPTNSPRSIGLALATVLVAGGLAGCSQGDIQVNPTAGASASASASVQASAQPRAEDSARASGTASPSRTALPSEEPSKAPVKPTPVVTRPVKAPQGGSVHATVKAKPVTSAKGVDLNATSVVSQKVHLRLASVKATQIEATIPGDRSGPGIQFTVEVDNRSASPIDTGAAVVNVYGSDQSPADLNSGAPTKVLPATIPAGGKATGVYSFRIDQAKRNPVLVEVSLAPGHDVAVFRGDIG